MPAGKLIIVTAPSGAGKTTIVKHVLQQFPSLRFSVSATTREKRNHEVDGKDYYFISSDTFEKNIAEGVFVEWQEVYPGKYYGTLHAELERIWAEGNHIIFDVDVKGAYNLQHMYPHNSVSIFIKPPSAEVLIERLKNRKTETPESLAIRLERVRMELSWEKKFDYVIVNDDLESAKNEADNLVASFLNTKLK